MPDQPKNAKAPTPSSTRPGSVMLSLLFAFCCGAAAQNAPPGQPPRAGGNWERVKAVPVHTKLHISTDHGGKTCRIFAVTDDTLTCAKGDKAGAVLQRAEIQHIKLTHVVRSTLVGAGIAGGIGAVAGAVAGRGNSCKAGETLCFNLFTGGDVAAIFGLGAGVVGAVVGGTTDLARGSSIYIRP